MISRVVLTSLVASALLSISGCKESNPYFIPKDATAPDSRVIPPDAANLDAATSPDSSSNPDVNPRLDMAIRDTALDRPNDQDAAPDLPSDRGSMGPDGESTDALKAETGSRDGRPDLVTGPDARDARVFPDVPSAETGDAKPVDADVCVEGATQNCSNIQYPSTNVCQTGTRLCLGGSWGACVGAIDPIGVEVCNNQDDTCNGSVDDGLPATTCGLGACAKTLASCGAGIAQACVPAPPAVATDETCDGVDDNCNGIVDEGCPTCVHVSPAGDDASADGTGDLPFATIQAAIDFANAAADRPKQVCVARAATCAEDSAEYLGPIVIPQGISVLGGYASSDWSVCPDTTLGTTLKTGAAAGITFTATAATTRTELARFAIYREVATSAEALAGVTVDGVSDVVLSNLSITDEPASPKTYGVNLLGGASVTILRSTLHAGGGTAESMAVRVGKGTLSLRENCDTIDATTGGCATPCDSATLGLFGRKDTTQADGSETSGLWLGEAENSLVQANTICGGAADHAAALRIAGKATGVVARDNVIENSGGALSAQAIQIADCEDASPLITANARIGATAAVETADVDTIRSEGKCHPVIGKNTRIEVNGLGNGTVNAIHCRSGSRCAILGNGDIHGSAPDLGARVVGIRCDGDKSCAKVVDNTIDIASGRELVGVLLNANHTVVAANTITGGCAQSTTTGILFQEGSHALVSNNRITASTCTATDASTTRYYGIRLLHDGNVNAPVITGNTVDPVGLAGADCESQAIDLSSSTAGAKPAGTFTDNTLFPGACDTAFGFVESGDLHARLVKGNNFVPGTGTTPALYSRGGASVGDIAAVNALGGGTISGENTSTTP